MAAYMVIRATITDFPSFMKYGAAAADLVAKMGGEYITAKGQPALCLEGEWDDDEKLLISRWPSKEAALAFWNSDEYQEIKKLRAGNSAVKVRLVEGA